MALERLLRHLATHRTMTKPKSKWKRLAFVGAGFLVLGLLVTLPVLIAAKHRSQSESCRSHLVSLGLIARLWADEYGDRMPTNYECMTHAQELPMTRANGWVCPGDERNPMARLRDWSNFNPAHASYEIVSPGVADTETNAVLFRCKIHGHLCYADGSVYDGVSRRWGK